jgi:S1-C subfamily serine protease
MRAMNSVVMAVVFGKGHTRHLAPAAQWGVLAGKEVGDEDVGVDIKEVVPGSAAHKAGLKRGDRLLTLDGRWTDSIADLYDAAGYVKAGTKAIVRIKRAGKEMNLEVTPARGM